jgi:hypothetical protein
MQLDSLNLAYLHVMDGLAFGFHELGEPMMSKGEESFSKLIEEKIHYIKEMEY